MATTDTLDLNQIATFVRVVDAGSFSRAAQQLGLPTSTMSHRVKALEQKLGATLLLRSTRRLGLTPEGERFFQEARRGIEALRNAELSLSAAALIPSGRLRIAAPVDIGDAMMAALLSRVRRELPRVSLDLRLSNRALNLISGEIDVAIHPGRLLDTNVVARRVGWIRWQLYASAAYLANCTPPRTPAELSAHALVEFRLLGSTHWRLHKAGSTERVALSGKTVLDDAALVQALLEQGAGIGLLPAHVAAPAVEAGRLVPVLTDWAGTKDPLSLLTPPARFMPLAVRRFLDIASDELGRWLA